jgi:hypothetical protein
LTRVGILGEPRPVPRRWAPTAGGGLAIALALPVFLAAGWRLSGWAIAAVLWAGGQAFGLLLARITPSADNLAASGVLAFGMMIRLLAVLVVLLVVASSDRDLGLAAALVYGFAYTVELGLSLVGYYSQEPTA